jgi:hypothetical protein
MRKTGRSAGDVDFDLCLTLGSFALFFGFLQVGLQLRVELVDLFQKFCFAVGASLGMLRFCDERRKPAS